MKAKKQWIIAILSCVLVVCCNSEDVFEPQSVSLDGQKASKVVSTADEVRATANIVEEEDTLILEEESCDLPDNVIPDPNQPCRKRKQDGGKNLNNKQVTTTEKRVESGPDLHHGQLQFPEQSETEAVDSESADSEPSGFPEKDSAGTKDSETADNSIKRQTKLVLQAVGVFEDDAETTDGQDDQSETEDEVWTEQTDEGTEQKRTSGRRFFSLMNLIKFLLNPVIEEFQEMEKSASSTDQSGASASGTAATSSGNRSKLTNTPSPNSSGLKDKDERKNSTDSGKKTKFQCTGRNVTENTTATVRVVNSTVLLELLSFDKNHTTSDCVLVMFYAPWCHFCAATAPHYNAVARAFPQLEVLAVDTVHFSNLNARFGTVAVPNIMLFHQSRSAVRFNHTDRNFQTLVQFITNTTGLEANSSVELSSQDYEGPLSSVPTEETDYLLWFAWLFIIVCSGYIFISSEVGQHAIDRVNVLWQEHQHQHIE